MTSIRTLAEIENIVGKSPAPRDLKLIDYIDDNASAWLSHSHFAFMAFGANGGVRLTLAGGDKGFVSAPDRSQIAVPLAALDDQALAVEGVSFGGLFIVSGMEETLRVNGRVSGISGDTAVVAVEECYLHCAKSFRRSGFWQAAPREAMGEDSATFVGQATFLALATINSKGQVDVSPKGDPAGILIQAYEAGYCFADRPGNKRIDSFRNLIEQPAASIIAIVPGSEAVLEIQGTATLGTDADLLPRFAVQGKTPKLVTKVAAESTTVRNSPAIAASALWPAQPAPDDLNPSAIFKAHIRKSKESSLKAKVARAAVSVPGAFEAGLQADYKKNMY